MTITTIESISDARDFQAEACARYSRGNDDGAGYAWDEAPEGARRIWDAYEDESRGGLDVWVLADGSEVAVGDVNGPWAVTITPAQG